MKYVVKKSGNKYVKLWLSIDINRLTGIERKLFCGKTYSIIHEPVWRQSRAFQDAHGEYIRIAASAHRIPYQLLAAILFTEMTYDMTPLWIDDYGSMLIMILKESSSFGPGQMNVFHMKRWGFTGNKWELAKRLREDVKVAIDASARLLRELAEEYIRMNFNRFRTEHDKQYDEESMMRLRRGEYTPYEISGYVSITRHGTKNRLSTENIEKDTWPTIAGWYNAGVGKHSNAYRNKFENSLRALGY